MITSEITNLIIEAEMIAVDVSAYNTIQTFTIHKPVKATQHQLDMLNKSDLINGVTLVDEFDNGVEDIHENKSTYEVVAKFSGDSRKKKTITLILIDLDKVTRLQMNSM